MEKTYEAKQLVNMIEVLKGCKKTYKAQLKLNEYIAAWRGLSLAESNFELKENEIKDLLELAELVGMKEYHEYF